MRSKVKYQAAHQELVASSMATKLAHEIDPENKVGCMLAAGQYYPNTAHPRDYWAAMQEDRSNYFFIDGIPHGINVGCQVVNTIIVFNITIFIWCIHSTNPILNDKHRFLVTIPNSIEGNTKA